MLIFSDDIKFFYIEANSLDFTIRAVLSQQSKSDGKWHPVVFFSKFLFLFEQNYKIHNKKMLVIIHILKERKEEFSRRCSKSG